MKLLFALSLVVFAVGCTKTESKASSAPLASVAPPIKLEGQPPVVAASPASPAKKVCVKGTEKHEFEIKKNGNGCILNSIDSGKIKEEATSDSGTKKCEKKEKHLVARLTHSGFQCL